MSAYSRLTRLLSERRMTVPELHRQIRQRGLTANVKSLYRLSTTNRPLERLDLRLAAAICEVLGVSLTELISFDSSTGELRQLGNRSQRRLENLMSLNREGLLDAEGR